MDKTVLDQSIEILDRLRGLKLVFFASKEEIDAMDTLLSLGKDIQSGSIKIYEGTNVNIRT